MRSSLSIDEAWNSLFEKHDIVSKIQEHGIFKISSQEINTVKEARLMAKFDQSSHLPEVFKSNKLSILPITRGEYVIGPFNTHAPVTYSDVKPVPVEIPDLQTIDYTNLYSEASALLFAYNSGIINDVMGSSKINFTVNGRMSSGNFEYYIGNQLNPSENHKILVQNAQVEIDAGYESPDAFCICEAKNMASEEILIRQLYYPYRLWCSKITKPVVPVFLVFSNDIFHVFTYTFENLEYYNSLKLLSHKAYTFANEFISLSDVIDIWRNTKVLTEPDVTFPQADSFSRIVDLLSVLFENDLTRNEVTLKYEFDPRQTNYYISACEYLGLIERSANDEKERVYRLTKEARKIMSLRYKPKYLELMRKIFQCPVFSRSFELAIKISAVPNKAEICKIMNAANLSINSVTIGRRSSTVRGWIDWILRLSSD